MSLTSPVVRITAGAIAGVLSLGTGVAIHAQSSGGGGNGAVQVDGSTAARAGQRDGGVQATGSLADGAVAPAGGATFNANGGSGGGRASTGARAQTSRPGVVALPRVGPAGASINLPLPNTGLGTSGGGTGGNGASASNGGGGGGGQSGVGSVPPLNAQGSHSVVVPATPRVDKKLCLEGTAANRCERITVNSVPGTTLALAYAGNGSTHPPTFSVAPCTGGLVVTVAGLTPGASVTVKVNGQTILSGSVTSQPVGQSASLCDA